jgi:catechol 2,3-dioxygenase-like lactoylglutathione lyase family enzyme
MPQVTGIDHIYITCSDMARSEAFYDRVLVDALGFCKGGTFDLGPDTHVSYYSRHFGFVLRPARVQTVHEPYAPGLHHFCFRVDAHADVIEVADLLQKAGVAATPAKLYPDYAPDYWATFFEDPDGVRLEVTNYRQERRERHEHWEALDSGQPSEWDARMESLWAAMAQYNEAEFLQTHELLVGELSDHSAVASFERGGAQDSTGHPEQAIVFYRQALAQGLDPSRRRQATIQLASSLRNLGQTQEAAQLLRCELELPADALTPAVQAFLALVLTDMGQEREAVALSLEALSGYLPRYNRSLARYAQRLKKN